MTHMRDHTAQAAAGVKSILVLLLLSAGLMAGSSMNAYASDSSTSVLIADAAPAPEARGASTQADGPVAHVDARIRKLHKKLHITAAQEPQFNAFAEVMRGNAQTMHALFQQRGQSTDTTAVAHLRWYAQMTAAHADGLNKLIPVFDALYQSLSDQQKKTADTVFDEIGERRRPHRAR